MTAANETSVTITDTDEGLTIEGYRGGGLRVFTDRPITFRDCHLDKQLAVSSLSDAAES